MAACTGLESNASSLARREERDEYFEKGVEEEPQRSESKRCPLLSGPQKQHSEDWSKDNGGSLEKVKPVTFPAYSQGGQPQL